MPDHASLVRVEIQNFRSVEDSTAFGIDDLTCLVGKNEAGKTALLQALHALRPFNAAKTTFDVTLEYPRRFVTKFDERHEKEPPFAVRTWWNLGEKAKAALANEFGPEAIIGEEFEVTKRYDRAETIWTLPLNEAAAIAILIRQAQLNAVEQKVLGDAGSATSLLAKLDAIAEKTPKHVALKARIEGFRDKSFFKRGIDLVEPFVPQFFYTSHYDRMSGQISINKFVADQAAKKLDIADSIFLDFLKLAGTSVEELSDAKRYEELIAKCEAASNDITEQIFAYWTQNDALEVKLDISEGRAEDAVPFNTGTVVRARVWNTLHRASVPFSERSAGFVWFFSFLVQFAAMRGTKTPLIILLDEPGLTLHGKAQADLLRYIEKELLPHHYVIFSTHSPFMVPAHRLTSVRVVEDVVERVKDARPVVKGTKVREDILVTDRGTLFPLQGALGYDIAQSLFVGRNTLLVEGPSDILYLQALSDALKKRNRTSLDPRWTLCPSGGIDKLHPFISLFGGNNLNIAVLSDFAKVDRKKVDELRRTEILKAGHFYTVVDFMDKPEGDIEDVLEQALYLKIVNSAYALPAAHRITPAKLVATGLETERQVKMIEAAFRVLPDTIPIFDHFTPASWLIRNPATLDGDGHDATLALAERIFTAFNALL